MGMTACDRCRTDPGEPLIPWSGERLCWPCADRQLAQVADDALQPYGTPVHAGSLR
jgi:hypothetical protein